MAPAMSSLAFAGHLVGVKQSTSALSSLNKVLDGALGAVSDITSPQSLDQAMHAFFQLPKIFFQTRLGCTPPDDAPIRNFDSVVCALYLGGPDADACNTNGDTSGASLCHSDTQQFTASVDALINAGVCPNKDAAMQRWAKLKQELLQAQSLNGTDGHCVQAANNEQLCGWGTEKAACQMGCTQAGLNCAHPSSTTPAPTLSPSAVAPAPDDGSIGGSAANATPLPGAVVPVGPGATATTGQSQSLSTGAIVGIALGSLAALAAAVLALLWLMRRRRRHQQRSGMHKPADRPATSVLANRNSAPYTQLDSSSGPDHLLPPTRNPEMSQTANRETLLPSDGVTGSNAAVVGLTSAAAAAAASAPDRSLATDTETPATNLHDSGDLTSAHPLPGLTQPAALDGEAPRPSAHSIPVMLDRDQRERPLSVVTSSSAAISSKYGSEIPMSSFPPPPLHPPPQQLSRSSHRNSAQSSTLGDISEVNDTALSAEAEPLRAHVSMLDRQQTVLLPPVAVVPDVTAALSTELDTTTAMPSPTLHDHSSGAPMMPLPNVAFPRMSAASNASGSTLNTVEIRNSAATLSGFAAPPEGTPPSTLQNADNPSPTPSDSPPVSLYVFHPEDPFLPHNGILPPPPPLVTTLGPHAHDLMTLPPPPLPSDRRASSNRDSLAVKAMDAFELQQHLDSQLVDQPPRISEDLLSSIPLPPAPPAVSFGGSSGGYASTHQHNNSRTSLISKRSMSMSSMSTSMSSGSELSIPTSPTRMTIVSGYHKRLDDELDVLPRDTVMLLRRFTDGWAYGVNLRTEAEGGKLAPVKLQSPADVLQLCAVSSNQSVAALSSMCSYAHQGVPASASPSPHSFTVIGCGVVNMSHTSSSNTTTATQKWKCLSSGDLEDLKFAPDCPMQGLVLPAALMSTPTNSPAANNNSARPLMPKAATDTAIASSPSSSSFKNSPLFLPVVSGLASAGIVLLAAALVIWGRRYLEGLRRRRSPRTLLASAQRASPPPSPMVNKQRTLTPRERSGMVWRPTFITGPVPPSQVLGKPGSPSASSSITVSKSTSAAEAAINANNHPLTLPMVHATGSSLHINHSLEATLKRPAAAAAATPSLSQPPDVQSLSSSTSITGHIVLSPLVPNLDLSDIRLRSSATGSHQSATHGAYAGQQYRNSVLRWHPDNTFTDGRPLTATMDAAIQGAHPQPLTPARSTQTSLHSMPADLSGEEGGAEQRYESHPPKRVPRALVLSPVSLTPPGFLDSLGSPVRSAPLLTPPSERIYTSSSNLSLPYTVRSVRDHGMSLPPSPSQRMSHSATALLGGSSRTSLPSFSAPPPPPVIPPRIEQTFATAMSAGGPNQETASLALSYYFHKNSLDRSSVKSDVSVGLPRMSASTEPEDYVPFAVRRRRSSISPQPKYAPLMPSLSSLIASARSPGLASRSSLSSSGSDDRYPHQDDVPSEVVIHMPSLARDLPSPPPPLPLPQQSARPPWRPASTYYTNISIDSSQIEYDAPHRHPAQATYEITNMSQHVTALARALLPEQMLTTARSLGLSPVTVLALSAALPLICYMLYQQHLSSATAAAADADEDAKKDTSAARLPPTVPHLVPFIGSMISYGMRPLDFLREQRERHGDCFTFTMWGRKMTYVMGAEGNNFLFNAKLAHVSAEDAYRSLTKPVFGDDVVYDVHNAVLMEQKKFVKGGLSNENLRAYVGMIQSETEEYFKRWDGTDGMAELSRALAELTIMTASCCLLGKEIRAQLDETVAELYHHLDQGFQPINFLFESLPLPSYRRRDIAQQKMANLFLNIIKERRQTGRMDNQDVLQSLMEAEYKNGQPFSDKEAAHLMIALLMAGQHTSSTTGTWCLSYLTANPAIVDDLIAEMQSVLGDDMQGLTFEKLKQLELLDACIRETLRLRPPIIVIMRKVIQPVQFRDYVIPAGHYLCASPAISQLDPAAYPDPMTFNPYRWLNKDDAKMTEQRKLENETGEDFGWGAVGGSAKSNYLPFGAGRHRCIGEPFAYVQLKTIIATFLREFSVRFPQGPSGFPKSDYSSMIVMPVKPINLLYHRRRAAAAEHN
ncbi:Lanosterol 14-alpha-demethylase [Sorochytrium milnesiophthora]